MNDLRPRSVLPPALGVLLLAVVLAAPGPALGPSPEGGARSAAAGAVVPAPASGDYGFRFVRIKYESMSGARWGRETWAYDYPTAEENLYKAIERTTNLYIEGPPVVRTLDDERIFNHPILYLCEPGYWMTNEQEIENLKRYFAQGGFMIIDDFHDRGGYSPQWDNFYHNIKRVFPKRELVRLDASHPVWSIYYDVDPVEAASTKGGFGKLDDEYYAIFDDNGRMMLVVCYNQDIGDGWEWPGRNLANASTTSFQMAINFITYALTH